jgi:CRISPR/Cas system CSM-associated protein Csm3 (group 7 of RAMP superfamily)
MDINYKLTFLSDWHVGSGLSGGAEADAILLKDKNDLPYLPGKTIKGLVRDAIADMKDAGQLETELESIFGSEGNHEIRVASFSNVEIKDEYEEIVSNNLSDYLYRIIASTKIEENGIASQGSLRSIEVCLPVTLDGKISNIETEEINTIFKQALKLVRSAGVNRNRGLGRCKIEII